MTPEEFQQRIHEMREQFGGFLVFYHIIATCRKTII